jgi:multisubunit Na+/H+ antiporter MnhB subunit
MERGSISHLLKFLGVSIIPVGLSVVFIYHEAAGVCSAMLIAAGTFVYCTLSNRQDRIEGTFSLFSDKTVSRQEMDWR